MSISSNALREVEEKGSRVWKQKREIFFTYPVELIFIVEFCYLVSAVDAERICKFDRVGWCGTGVAGVVFHITPLALRNALLFLCLLPFLTSTSVYPVASFFVVSFISAHEAKSFCFISRPPLQGFVLDIFINIFYLLIWPKYGRG